MAQLGQTIYLQSLVNGYPVFQAIPWGGNVPSGTTILTKDQYVQGIQNAISNVNANRSGYNWTDQTQSSGAKYGQTEKNGNIVNYTGPDQTYIDNLQKQLSGAQSGAGIYADNYRDPQFKDYVADAPFPSNANLTPEAKALYDSSNAAYQNMLATQNKNNTANSPTNISVNLQQGSTGDAVKQLQTALGITADGVYGPQTAAAVKAFQTKNGLTPDGVYGPQTAAKISSSNNNTTSGTSTGGSVTGGGTSSSSTTTNGSTNNTSSSSVANYDTSLLKYGITQDVWNQMSQTQQAVVSAATGAANALYGANASNVTLDTALQAAATDPTLIAKYADALKIDQNTFQQSLQQLQQATSTDAQQKQTQFENDRRALAENYANTGEAYSGLRSRAQEQLGEQQSGIVSSSRNTLQKNLQDLTSAFESKYGTGASQAATSQFTDPYASSGISLSGLKTTPTSTTDTLSGNLAGGITGTQPVAKQQDINSLAGSYVNLGQIPSFA